MDHVARLYILCEKDTVKSACHRCAHRAYIYMLPFLYHVPSRATFYFLPVLHSVIYTFFESFYFSLTESLGWIMTHLQSYFPMRANLFMLEVKKILYTDFRYLTRGDYMNVFSLSYHSSWSREQGRFREGNSEAIMASTGASEGS